MAPVVQVSCFIVITMYPIGSVVERAGKNQGPVLALEYAICLDKQRNKNCRYRSHDFLKNSAIFGEDSFLGNSTTYTTISEK